jgi:hypothetical protein
MTRNETLIWVHLHDGRDGFFGSLAAIYGVFKHEDIGISLDGLYSTDLPYGNKYCFIRRISVHRKPQKRN